MEAPLPAMRIRRSLSKPGPAHPRAKWLKMATMVPERFDRFALILAGLKMAPAISTYLNKLASEGYRAQAREP